MSTDLKIYDKIRALAGNYKIMHNDVEWRCVLRNDDVLRGAKEVLPIYNVTVTSSNSSYGTVTGGGSYEMGTNITITASANTGYEFTGWYVNNTLVSSSSTYSFYVTGDVSIQGRFADIDYSSRYLTIESLEDNNTIEIYKKSGAAANTLYVSKNNGSWTQYTSTAGEIFDVKISLNRGDTLRFRAEATYWGWNTIISGPSGTYTSYYGWNFESWKTSNVYGNIMSLLYGSNYRNYTELPSAGYPTFGALFNGSKLVDAYNLVLPALTLQGRNSCYAQMFYGCTSLTRAPKELPATIIDGGCYHEMFRGCTSLTTAPTLPNTMSFYYNASGSMNAMFYGCTSLTTAPSILPALTLNLNQACYKEMFYGCTALTTAPSLPATKVGNQCYDSMFEGCTALTTAPSLPATTIGQYCYREMFKSCTSLTTAPSILPATTLRKGCYDCMFYGCSSLTTAPELPATTLVEGCYWGTFFECSNLNYIKCLATDITATNCLRDWVYDVAASGTFVKASSMNNWSSGVNGIPNGWTVVNAA